MDATLLTRKQLERQEREIRKLKKKLKRSSKKDLLEGGDTPVPPRKPAADLEDVIQQSVKVTKEPVPPPLVIDEPAEVEAKVPETTTKNPDKEESGIDEEPQEVIRSSDVFAYQPPKKRRNDSDSSSYGAAYEELYKMLCTRMLNRFLRYFARVYRKCKTDKECKQSLAEIPDWSQKQIKARAKEFVDSFPDIESYYKFAYAANLMLMSSIVQKSEASEDVEVEVPPFSEFVHKCYIECARAVYDNIGCLSEDLSHRKRIVIQRELLLAYSNAIATALRLLIPLDKLISIEPGENFDDAELLSEDSEEEEEEEEAQGGEEEDDSGSDGSSGSSGSSSDGSDSESSDSSSGSDDSSSESDSDSSSSGSR